MFKRTDSSRALNEEMKEEFLPTLSLASIDHPFYSGCVITADGAAGKSFYKVIGFHEQGFGNMKNCLITVQICSTESRM
jgi:hypothetical protein